MSRSLGESELHEEELNNDSLGRVIRWRIAEMVKPQDCVMIVDVSDLPFTIE